MSHTDVLNLLASKPDLANAVAAIASAILAAVACFISMVSLYVALATLKHQRDHNILSVRPIPFVALGDYENSIYIKLQNSGTGPLIIKRLQVHGAEDPTAPLVEAMPELLPKATWTNFVGSVQGRSIIAGSELGLLELSSANPNGHYVLSRDKVRAALGNLRLSIEYTDIYATSFPVYERNLKWFHRTVAESQANVRTELKR
ncbi:hypothetical protein LP414_18590 [Polaromonas sp. P1(28)-13]|nr:hypothetical protein LP414_18590 [Polaromonas sp. P1(28)-13]